MSEHGSSAADGVGPLDVDAMLADWRTARAPGLGPVHVRFVEALARRARACDGPARRLLDDRLRHLLGCAKPTGATGPAEPPKPTPTHRGPLAELLSALARPPLPVAATPARSGPSTSDPPALQYFRRTWSTLSANQRLAQSLSAVPENAGPLNSLHLVHRALRLMRDVSPQYLERFVAHVDALLWLEQANDVDERSPAPRRPPAR